MNRELSIEWFNKHVDDMLEDPNLMSKGIALVHRDVDYVVISIPIQRYAKSIFLKIVNVNFDIDPVDVYFVDSVNFKKLSRECYPSGNGIVDGHDFLPNPIICISSTYSYHTHPSHRNTPFDLYRNTFYLSNLIKRIIVHLETDWHVPEGGCA